MAEITYSEMAPFKPWAITHFRLNNATQGQGQIRDQSVCATAAVTEGCSCLVFFCVCPALFVDPHPQVQLIHYTLFGCTYPFCFSRQVDLLFFSPVCSHEPTVTPPLQWLGSCDVARSGRRSSKDDLWILLVHTNFPPLFFFSSVEFVSGDFLLHFTN